ncbi:RND transporter [Pseudoalteromonas sp. MSK9-3]|uniref:efflux RND transporter permease subunit n=1 Tax=Pseudoalteromonas sp. MSK9-3 TaxID=1897633 RepID=UPI000E6C0BF4|nr:MMPL family transporter [Pseudoalteromonas sp. MSK9-3]RJE76299.1 RND transporter [Pseudoalteromonas sp. MSK9-3]
MTNKIKKSTLYEYTCKIVKYRFIVIALTILVCFLIGQGQSKIGVNTDYKYFFGETTPQITAMEELEATYSKNDNVFFAITPTTEKDIFSKEVLTALNEMTNKAWQLPFVTRVDSLANFQHIEANEEGLIVEDLIRHPEQLNQVKINKIKQVALTEPLLINRIISPNGQNAGMNIIIQLPGESPMETFQIVGAARELIKDIEARYPVEIRLTGVTVLNATFGEVGASDLQNLTPIMHGLMILLLLVLFRSMWMLLATLAIVQLSKMSAMGMVGFLGIPITAPSSIAATIIMTLAVADSVHIIMGMVSEMRNGVERKFAVIESVKKHFVAILVTSLTTVVGFLSLNFSDAPPYHDLGNITAIGVIFAFILSVTILPALLTLLPIKVKARSTEQTITGKFFNTLNEFVVRRRGSIIITSILLISVCSSYIPKLILDDKFVEYFSEEINFRTESNYISDNLTGLYTIEFNIKSNMPNGVANPNFMKQVEKFASFYREQGNVYNVNVYTDIMKRLNRSLHSDDQNEYKLPDTATEAAQYLLLYEMSLPYGLDLTNQISMDKSETKLIVTMRDVSTVELRKAAELGENWWRNNASYDPIIGSGATVVFSHMSKANIEGMITGTALSFLLVTIFMFISLRSIKYGLISMIANIFPAIIAFGIWTILYQEAGMAISIVASATLGIIVDDCVHFLSKYVSAKRDLGYSAEKALSYAYNSVGVALVFTSVTLMTGFIVLATSPFLINSTLGILSAITVFAALTIDFLLLPAVLLLVDGSKKAQLDTKSLSSAPSMKTAN